MDFMTHELIIYKRKIIVAAQIKGINDYRELKFILDTGASKSINSKILKLPKFSLFGKDVVNFEVSVFNSTRNPFVISEHR
jgi:hypothetical protein